MLTDVLLLIVSNDFFKKPMLTHVNIGFYKKPMLTNVLLLNFNIGFLQKTDVNECVIIEKTDVNECVAIDS